MTLGQIMDNNNVKYYQGVKKLWHGQDEDFQMDRLTGLFLYIPKLFYVGGGYTIIRQVDSWIQKFLQVSIDLQPLDYIAKG